MKITFRLAALLAAITLTLTIAGCSNGSVKDSDSTKLAGIVSYATTIMEKNLEDAAFINPLIKTGDGNVVYSSSDPNVATVDAKTGEVSIKTAGQTTISATVSDSAIYTYAASRSASYALRVIDSMTIPLTLEFPTDGTITFEYKPDSLQYSKDGGKTKIAAGDSIAVSANEAVSFFANGMGSDQSMVRFTIKPDKDCYIYGNIMSLETPVNFQYCTIIKNEYEFSCLFDGAPIKNHPTKKLLLPAVSLKSHCYAAMFQSTKLTEAPELPAVDLKTSCYNSMFQKCADLERAPKLPATDLSVNCYWQMFTECVNLETAPDLLAKKLTTGCYTKMFCGCSKLKYIKCLATDIPSLQSQACLTNWVDGVAASGTFVRSKIVDEDWNDGDSSGIPPNWTVERVTE